MRGPAGLITSCTLAGALLCIAGAGPAAAEPVDARPVVSQRVVPAAVRRGPTRLRIYRSNPGPNSVRQCEAHYVQEYRQAGTVIVPRVNCWWEG